MSACRVFVGSAVLQLVEIQLEDTEDSNQWKVIQSV